MADFALPTLYALAGVLAGYGATTLYHRRRNRARDLRQRLLRGRDSSHIERAVLTEAATVVDAAYTRLTHQTDSQEGGPTP
ncbi:hypothetical protein [Streptomyces cinereoruber]|uniref:hypothetical protein n=1 Tax=Streptomyces cinereoruber TaxID=67260 RepID=UPI0036434DA7